MDEAMVRLKERSLFSVLMIRVVLSGGQSSDIKNIVKTLQYLFDDDRFDLVPSDVAAGLILLQQEDVLEERSIEASQAAPLALLKEGLYYNGYAQSAFGW